MNWFEEWFDTSLYEKLYANRDEAEAKKLISLLERTLSSHHCKTILDLACGRGRHSINLGEKGYDVTGIDLSEQAVKTAKEKAGDRNLKNVHFKVRDMRNPLPQKFDAVVNLFTSFGYFLADEENASIFDSVAKMLKPGGIFVLDYLNAEKVKKEFVSEENGSFHEIDYHIERHIENEAIYKDINFKKGERRKSYSERVKLYGLQWFEKEMQKRNLIIDNVYGDYEGSDFDEDESQRLLITSHLK